MNPIFSIWINPRQTFQFLEQRNEAKNNTSINILFFLTAGATHVADINKPISGNFYIDLMISLVLSGLIGLFLWKFVLSYIVLGVGKIFKGKATKNEINLTLAFSFVPNLVHLVIALIMIIPAIIFKNDQLIIYQHPITIIVLWIVAARILLYGLAYFNKYTYGYALLTVIISAALMQGIVYGIKMLTGL